MNKSIFNRIAFYDGNSISDFVDSKEVNADLFAVITDRFTGVIISDAEKVYAEHHVDTERKVLAAIRGVIACQEFGRISANVAKSSYEYFLNSDPVQNEKTVKQLETYLSKSLIKDISHFVPDDFSIILCKLADSKLVFNEDEILREVKSKRIVIDDDMKYALKKNEETRTSLELNEYGILLSIDDFVTYIKTRNDSSKGYLLMKPFLDEYLQNCDKPNAKAFLYSSSGLVGCRIISKLKDNSSINFGFSAEVRYFCEGDINTIQLRKNLFSSLMFKKSENPLDFKIFTEEDMIKKYGYISNGYDLHQKIPELSTPYDAYAALDGSLITAIFKDKTLAEIVAPFVYRLSKKIAIVEKYSKKDVSVDGEEIYEFVGDN